MPNVLKQFLEHVVDGSTTVDVELHQQEDQARGPEDCVELVRLGAFRV